MKAWRVQNSGANHVGTCERWLTALSFTGGNAAVYGLSSCHFRRRFHRSSHSSCKVDLHGHIYPFIVHIFICSYNIIEQTLQTRQLFQYQD
jgi:hypothetical protein